MIDEVIEKHGVELADINEAVDAIIGAYDKQYEADMARLAERAEAFGTTEEFVQACREVAMRIQKDTREALDDFLSDLRTQYPSGHME